MSASELTEAANLFVMTKFDQCFNECNNIIKAAKCEPEPERNHKLIEAATALGIQALAETDTWYSVVSFITDVYGTVELSPPSIVQLCILLHAQVKEYLPCHKIVEMWLKNPHNLKHKHYNQVVRTYAHHILCPTGSFELLKDIAENCSCLTHSERTALLQLSKTKRYEESRVIRNGKDHPAFTESLSSNVSEVVSKSVQSTNSTSLPDMEDQDSDSCDSSKNNNNVIHPRNRAVERRSDDLSSLQAIVKWLYEIILIKLNYFRHPRFNLFLMGMIALWALIHIQTGDSISSWGRCVILWKIFLQRLGLLSSK